MDRQMWPPQLGTRYRYDGLTWIVSRVINGKVWLQALGEPHCLEIEPGEQGAIDELQLITDEASEPAPAYPFQDNTVQALLVGGDGGKHFTRLQELARPLGIRFISHVPVTRCAGYNDIPAGTGLVIIVHSHVAHTASIYYKTLAKVRGIPVARVPSRGFQHSLNMELSKLGLKVVV